MKDLVRNCQTQEADVYIGRGGPFGNPYKIPRDGDRQQVITLYRNWIIKNRYMLNMVAGLHGKTLGCYCRPEACHGDVLVELSQRKARQQIFVFGSNLAGRHGAGAAAFARQYYQAEPGIGRGRTGTSYAIPTKDRSLHSLSIRQIKPHVEQFLDYAATHKQIEFQVTRIGCGLAGLKDQDIAELFVNASANVKLPGRWKWYLGHRMQPRVIVAGSRSITSYGYVKNSLNKFDNFSVEIVSGGARGVDVLGEDYAVEHGLEFKRFPARWDQYGRAAGHIRNQYMSWYATHLCAFWDGSSPGTANMIKTARTDRLKVKQL